MVYLKNANDVYVLDRYDGVSITEIPEGNRFDLYRDGEIVDTFYSKAKSVQELVYTPNLKKSLVLKFKTLTNRVAELEAENELLRNTNNFLNSNLEVMNDHTEKLSNRVNDLDVKFKNEKIHHQVTLAKTDSLERIVTGWEAGKKVKDSTTGTNPNSPMRKTSYSKYPNDESPKKTSVKFTWLNRDYVLKITSLDDITKYLELVPSLTHFYSDGYEITSLNQVTGTIVVDTDDFDIFVDDHPTTVNYSTQFEYLGDVIYSTGQLVNPNLNMFEMGVTPGTCFTTGMWVNVEEDARYTTYAYDPLNPTFTDRVPVHKGVRIPSPVNGCNLEYEHNIVIDFEGEHYTTYQVTPTMMVKPFLKSLGLSGYLTNGSTKLQVFGHYPHANYERDLLNITIKTSKGDVHLDVHPTDYIGSVKYGPLVHNNDELHLMSTFESAGIPNGAVLTIRRYPTRNRKSKKN